MSTMDVRETLERRHATMVQVLCGLFVAVCLGNEVARLFTRSPSLQPTYVVISLSNVIIAASSALAWRAARRRKLTQALTLLVAPPLTVAFVVVSVFGLAFLLDTMHAFPVVLALAALLSGRRALWITTGAYGLGMLVGRLRDLGVLGAAPTVPPHVPTLGNWGQTALGFLFLAVVLDRFGVALRDAYLASAARAEELERISKALADETEQRLKAQAALASSQRLEVIGRLSAGVAHDFNNLVMIIGGATEIARRHPDDPAVVTRNLDTIADSTRQAEHLTRQLLTLARRQHVSPRVISVDEVLSSLVPLLRRMVGNRVTVDCQLGAPGANVRIDPVQVEQLVLNLVSNSRDAMPKGGRLQLCTDVREDQLRLRVIDEGEGMDEPTRAHVFEPFFTTKPHGTGIGLAACLEIVTQAGGKLTVDSDRARGTTVTAWFPRVAEESAVAPPRRPGHGETVLVADDEPVLRRQLAQGLSQLGYRVVEAESGTAAVAAARTEQALRVVVTDLHMPGDLSGREVIERVRGDVPGVKFVLMSADAAALEGLSGVGDTLAVAKPISVDALGERVAALLSKPS
jgi:signal transduction histidine kinase/CheY-like chemotaxis protein